MTPRFVRRSEAPVRAVPVPLGVAGPKPERSVLAGFGAHVGAVAEVLTKKRRLLLVRAGADLEAAGALAAARLGAVEHIAIDARGWTGAEAARLAAGAAMRAWRFDRLFTRPNSGPDPERPVLARLDVMVDRPEAAEAGWAELGAGVAGAAFARDLVVEPADTLTPAGFVERLRGLEAHGLSLEVLGPERLAAEGFGGLLAVGRASVHPPCVAVLRWAGDGGGAAPVLFVGKGITFDTGGVCIKPAGPMWEMRADMAGAAACAGAMLALALRRSGTAAVAVMPLAENMVGAASYRPGDVLRMHNGTTVEIVDTDAEGRLVLADALSWAIGAERPQAVVDLATLTGANVVALGQQMAGLFATDDVLAAHLAAAGAAVDEPVWRMPLSEGYRDALISEIADVRQCAEGSYQPDACHAALFLRGFVGDVAWAHLDIAGMELRVAATDRYPAGPTGWGARLLDRLVRDRFEGG